MDPKLKETLVHLQQEGIITGAILVLAVILTYVVDLFRLLSRPDWLINGTEVLSIILFLIDAIYVLSIAVITVIQSIKGRLRNP